MFLILDVNHSKLISYQPKDCSPHFYVHSKNCYVLTQTTENCIKTVEGAACYKPRRSQKNGRISTDYIQTERRGINPKENLEFYQLSFGLVNRWLKFIN